MPTPDQQPPPEYRQIPKEFEKHLYGASAIAEHRLAEEVAKLRTEIQALRDEIAPKFSTIITGLEAMRIYQRRVLGG